MTEQSCESKWHNWHRVAVLYSCSLLTTTSLYPLLEISSLILQLPTRFVPVISYEITSQMLKHCGLAEVSRSSNDDYSTFELSRSKEAGRTFACSASAGSHTGPLLSKSPAVKKPVIRLRVALGPTREQKVAALMIYIHIYRYIHINFPFERLGWLVSARQLSWWPRVDGRANAQQPLLELQVTDFPLPLPPTSCEDDEALARAIAASLIEEDRPRPKPKRTAAANVRTL